MIEPTPLPCPFCGKEPWGVFGPHEELGSCWIECLSDGCGDWHHVADGKTMEEQRANTVTAWNRRHGL